MLKVTPDGEILREISIFDVLIKNGLQGPLVHVRPNIVIQRRSPATLST